VAAIARGTATANGLRHRGIVHVAVAVAVNVHDHVVTGLIPCMVKMVEAPGVEGREATSDFGMSREVSCEKERDWREKPERDETVGSVSLGLMQSGRSSEVSEAGVVRPAGDTPSATDD
jgi:hypothetical protein